MNGDNHQQRGGPNRRIIYYLTWLFWFAIAGSLLVIIVNAVPTPTSPRWLIKAAFVTFIIGSGFVAARAINWLEHRQ
jgi:hypothetical protein